MNTTQHNHETLEATIRSVMHSHGSYQLTLTLSDNKSEDRKYRAMTNDMTLIDDMRDEDDDIKWEARQRAVEVVLRKHQLPVLFIARNKGDIEVTLDI